MIKFTNKNKPNRFPKPARFSDLWKINSSSFTSIPYFPNPIWKLASQHQRIELKKNEFLLREGEISEEYYILESGIVRAFVYDYDQNEITTKLFVENDIVIVPSSLFQKIPSQEIYRQ